MPFSIAYASDSPLVGTNKWWSQVGLHWSFTAKDKKGQAVQTGFAFSWNDGLPRTLSFVDEPFCMQFVDYPANGSGNIYQTEIAGMGLFNMNSLCVNSSGRVVTVNKDGIGKTSSFGPCNVDNERGPVAEPQPIVTVGLHGVHPLGTQQPTQAPWTSVRVESYSDWGAVFSYASGGSKMQITAASGSPFLWIERVSGAQPFEIVAGSTEPHGAMSVGSNAGPNLGLTVTNDFLPSVPGTDLLKTNTFRPVYNTADYAIYADAGTWMQTKIN